MSVCLCVCVFFVVDFIYFPWFDLLTGRVSRIINREDCHDITCLQFTLQPSMHVGHRRLGGVSLTATDCPTGRRTILPCYLSIAEWSDARSDSQSMLVKHPPEPDTSVAVHLYHSVEQDRTANQRCRRPQCHKVIVSDNGAQQGNTHPPSAMRISL